MLLHLLLLLLLHDTMLGGRLQMTSIVRLLLHLWRHLLLHLWRHLLSHVTHTSGRRPVRRSQPRRVGGIHLLRHCNLSRHDTHALGLLRGCPSTRILCSCVLCIDTAGPSLTHVSAPGGRILGVGHEREVALRTIMTFEVGPLLEALVASDAKKGLLTCVCPDVGDHIATLRKRTCAVRALVDAVLALTDHDDGSWKRLRFNTATTHSLPHHRRRGWVLHGSGRHHRLLAMLHRPGRGNPSGSTVRGCIRHRLGRGAKSKLK